MPRFDQQTFRQRNKIFEDLTLLLFTFCKQIYCITLDSFKIILDQHCHLGIYKARDLRCTVDIHVFDHKSTCKYKMKYIYFSYYDRPTISEPFPG
jgi:hypothetical protein